MKVDIFSGLEKTISPQPKKMFFYLIERKKCFICCVKYFSFTDIISNKRVLILQLLYHGQPVFKRTVYLFLHYLMGIRIG